MKLIKNSMKFAAKNKGVLLTFVFMLAFSLWGVSQPPPPGGPTDCWPPPCIPIDGGIGWLIAAGVAYGAKKSWDFRKKEVEDRKSVV